MAQNPLGLVVDLIFSCLVFSKYKKFKNSGMTKLVKFFQHIVNFIFYFEFDQSNNEQPQKYRV